MLSAGVGFYFDSLQRACLLLTACLTVGHRKMANFAGGVETICKSTFFCETVHWQKGVVVTELLHSCCF